MARNVKAEVLLSIKANIKTILLFNSRLYVANFFIFLCLGGECRKNQSTARRNAEPYAEMGSLDDGGLKEKGHCGWSALAKEVM